VVEKLK